MPITDYSYFSIFTSGLTFSYRVKKSFYEFNYAQNTSALVKKFRLGESMGIVPVSVNSTSKR